MRKPTDGNITFPYGATSVPYSSSNPHAGVDYGARQGDNIYAPHAGKVTASGSMGACGLGIDIEQGQFKSRLCHNSQILVSNGQQVSEGQVIARAGATGQASGVHSHWVLWVNGNRVDPVKHLGDNQSDMSKVADTEIDQASWQYFGYGASQEFIKLHRGEESNTFFRWMFEHPVAKKYREQIAEWRAKAESGGSSVTKDSVLDYIKTNLK